MRAQFRGYIIKVWLGENLYTIKYAILNRILVSACIKYLHDCQIRRNKMLYNKTKQRTRIIKWYKAEREKAINRV